MFTAGGVARDDELRLTRAIRQSRHLRL